MNLKKFTLVSSVVLAALAVPMASAQSRGGRSSTATASTPHMTAPAGSGSGVHFAGRGSPPSNVSGSDRWRNHDWSHYHGFYPYYYSYYGGFGYPYGFGYPFGYGYGFGYPYYGASAALYYNGYGNGYGYRDGGGHRDRGGSLVSEVQQRLARAGYYRGAIDGVIGGGTRNAIRAWERSHGLRVDGRIDNQLLSTLGIA